VAAAVGAQALIVSVLTGLSGPRALVWGGFLAGLAIGIRSQTFLLTLPLFALALVLPRSGLRAQNRIAALGAAAIGVLLWAIPLIVASGGFAEYARALGSQAGEDLSGVVMLWTTRTKAVALDAAMYSFLWPWGHPIAGAAVLLVALLGAIRALWTMPRAVALLCVGYIPYAVFHLLFQETITVRYALPLVLPVGYLMICALDWGDGTAASVGTVAVALWSLFLSVPPRLRAVTRQPGLQSAQRAARSTPTQQGRVIGMRRVARAADWLQSFGGLTARRVLKAPHGKWLTLVAQWRADRRRRLRSSAIPPHRSGVDRSGSRRPPLPFRWGFPEPPFVGGAAEVRTCMRYRRLGGCSIAAGR
jgi:hypothetical protein